MEQERKTELTQCAFGDTIATSEPSKQGSQPGGNKDPSSTACLGAKSDLRSDVGRKIIRHGDWVVLKVTNGDQLVVQVAKNTIKISQDAKLNLNSLAGHPFGTVFRYEKGNWTQSNRLIHIEELNVDFDSLDPSASNRFLDDENDSQVLSASDIATLRKDLSADELLNKIVESSSSFSSKTLLSQRKYIAKKRKKHLIQLITYEPSLMEICDAYYNTAPAKIGGLRFDYLASMLTYADVCINRRIVLLDQTSGLMSGAIASRLQGTGKIFRINETEHKNNYRISRELGGSKEFLDAIVDLHLDILKVLESEGASRERAYKARKLDNPLEHVNTDGSEVISSNLPSTTALDSSCSIPNSQDDSSLQQDVNSKNDRCEQSAAQGESLDEKPLIHGSCFKSQKIDAVAIADKTANASMYEENSPSLSRQAMVKMHEASNLESYKDLMNNKADCCIAVISTYKASPGGPTDNLEELARDFLNLAHKCLVPDGRIVMFCRNMQPLSISQELMHSSSSYVHTRLEEYMLREHQHRGPRVASQR